MLHKDLVQAVRGEPSASAAAASWWRQSLISPILELDEVKDGDEIGELMASVPNRTLHLDPARLDAFAQTLTSKVDGELERRADQVLEVDAAVKLQATQWPNELLQNSADEAKLIVPGINWPIDLDMYVSLERVHIFASYLPDNGLTVIWAA